MAEVIVFSIDVRVVIPCAGGISEGPSGFLLVRVELMPIFFLDGDKISPTTEDTAAFVSKTTFPFIVFTLSTENTAERHQHPHK